MEREIGEGKVEMGEGKESVLWTKGGGSREEDRRGGKGANVRKNRLGGEEKAEGREGGEY